MYYINHVQSLKSTFYSLRNGCERSDKNSPSATKSLPSSVTDGWERPVAEGFFISRLQQTLKVKAQSLFFNRGIFSFLSFS